MRMIVPIEGRLHSHATSGGTNDTSSGNAATGSNSSTGSSSANSALPANMQISQAGFLQLISTQMQDQDPLNPTDPTQFLAQIEGLSEVSSLQSLQTSISGLASGIQASQVISGTALLGHSVLAPGTTATLASGGSVSGAVTAPAGANALEVTVTNASGALVDAFPVTPQASGYTSFTWNGSTSSGAQAPAGQYTIGVNAAVGTTAQSVSPLLYSTVTSVTLDPTSGSLDLNTVNGTVPLSSVVNVQ
ncbi:MAG TPA: FlgD immunoglobulin-like domain containing protein [Steroidobacteraceae bacterium]|jgi:flagellar basal-body rod modification protein FlgD|nr:FlgD immunoglobulin-like domain containing protein [Steroidobacteraceae bacterium]